MKKSILALLGAVLLTAGCTSTPVYETTLADGTQIRATFTQE